MYVNKLRRWALVGRPTDGRFAKTIEADRWGRIGEFLSYLFLFCYQIHLICYDLFVLILHWESVLMTHLLWLYVTRYLIIIIIKKKKVPVKTKHLKNGVVSAQGKRHCFKSPALRAKLLDQSDARHKKTWARLKLAWKLTSKKPTSWALTTTCFLPQTKYAIVSLSRVREAGVRVGCDLFITVISESHSDGHVFGALVVPPWYWPSIFFLSYLLLYSFVKRGIRNAFRVARTLGGSGPGLNSSSGALLSPHAFQSSWWNACVDYNFFSIIRKTSKSSTFNWLNKRMFLTVKLHLCGYFHL